MLFTCLILSQSARSLAFAKAVERPTTRTCFPVCDEMKLVLDTITSNTGPLSAPRRNHKSISVLFFSIYDRYVAFHSFKYRNQKQSCLSSTKAAESNYLQVLTEQMDFINDEQSHFSYVVPILPASRHTIPLLGSGYYDVSTRNSTHVRCDVTS